MNKYENYKPYDENSYRQMLDLRSRIERLNAAIHSRIASGEVTPELAEAEKELKELADAYNFLCQNLAEQRLAKTEEEAMEIASKQDEYINRVMNNTSRNGRRL